MRVIAGSARGRLLVAPKGLAVRPTTDKVKGAIFSMVDAEAFRRAAPDAEEVEFPFCRVLDLYAGTGALAIEALSRGAEWADLVETSPRARAAIAENLRRCDLAHRSRIHALPAERALSTLRGPYDLILLDPPYYDQGAGAVLEALGGSALVRPGTLVVLEHAQSTAPPPRAGRLLRSRTRRHGGTTISVFHCPEDGADA